MAGVQWTGGKFKKREAKRRGFQHCDKEERLKREHKNKDINKEKTHLNMSAYDLNYEQTCAKYDERLKPIIEATIKKQLEKANGKKTLRKDAVVLMDPIVYIPNELNEAQQRQFAQGIFDLFKGEYGDNYINGYAHFDEQHTYTDPETKLPKLSKNHIHNFIIPEKDGVLNAKKISERKEINRINALVEDYTFKTFGVHYITGKGTQPRRSVEQCKANDLNLQIESKTEDLQALKDEVIEVNNQLIGFNHSKEVMEKEHKAFEADIKAKEEKMQKDFEAQKSEKEQEISRLNDEKDAVIIEKEKQSKNLQEISAEIAVKEEEKKLHEEYQKRSFIGRFLMLLNETRAHKKLKDGLNDYAKKYNAMVREVEASRRAETRRAEQDRKIKKPLENILNRFNKHGIKSIEQFDEYLRLLEVNEPEKFEKLAKDLINNKDLQTVIEEKKNIKDEQITTRKFYEDFNLGEDR